MTQHSFGCIPSPPDERDFQLASYLAPVGLPASLSYRTMMMPVRSQGGLGSCVGFAATAIDEHMHQASDLSEMWCYDQCKQQDHLAQEGTYPRIAMKVLQAGVPDEVYWPYQDRYPPSTEPIPGAAGDAAQYRIGTYAMTPNVDALKAGLFMHGPMLLAIQIFENYGEVSRTGVFPLPAGRSISGHALALVGYNDETELWETKGSWGKDCGPFGGYHYIPYAVMPKIFWEAWTVVDESAIPKRWPDLPDMTVDDLASQDRAWQEGTMKGYPDGNFWPYNSVTRHQVGTVMVRLGLFKSNPWNELSDYQPATRGFVHAYIPQLRFDEERFEESLTRFQLLLLIGRYQRGV